MFTALIMYLIHPYGCLTSTMDSNRVADTSNGMHLLSRYSTAQNLVFKFLMFFLRSSGTKQGEDGYRLAFEDFLTDLLFTANRSEWYAWKIILTLLSSILIANFSNQALTINTRLKSLDYLGSVAA